MTIILFTGLGSFERAIQNSPCVKTPLFTFKLIVAFDGKDVEMPNVPCSLKLFWPKINSLPDVEIPNPETPALAQPSRESGVARSVLFEVDTISQRSRQAMPGSTGVGEDTTVSVGVGGNSVDVAVGSTSVSVGSGSGVLVGGTAVAITVGITTSVGGFMAAIICGHVVIRVTKIVTVPPMIAAKTVGLEKGFFVSSSEPDFLLI